MILSALIYLLHILSDSKNMNCSFINLEIRTSYSNLVTVGL